MKSSTPSTPISIPVSERQRSYSSSSSEDGDGFRSSALTTAMERTDSLGDLQVGSLPMHLRRAGRSGRQRQLSGGTGGFFGPQSLPPPRAPILSSRGGPDGNLSSIPDMSLPESVASTDPELSASLPYGSLRESKFAHPGFGFERVPSHAQQQTTTTFQPQSLPAYGGIGSYFPANNNLSRDSSHSGIGSLIEESDEMGGMRQSQTDSVSGISQAMNSGLQLNEGGNYSGPGGLSTVVFHQPIRDGPTNNNYDSAPLSSSLTALDLLTQMRQSPDRGTTIAPHDNRAQEESNHLAQQPQQLEQQTAPPMQHLPQFSSYARHHSSGVEPNLAHDEEIDDNNPDTFEAFDFELDG